MVEIANLVEGIVWITIGVCFLVWLVRPGRRPAKATAAVTFLAFGLSDFVEMRAGSGADPFWIPWWLWAWKAACVGIMLVLFVGYLRTARRAKAA